MPKLAEIISSKLTELESNLSNNPSDSIKHYISFVNDLKKIRTQLISMYEKLPISQPKDAAARDWYTCFSDDSIASRLSSVFARIDITLDTPFSLSRLDKHLQTMLSETSNPAEDTDEFKVTELFKFFSSDPKNCRRDAEDSSGYTAVDRASLEQVAKFNIEDFEGTVRFPR